VSHVWAVLLGIVQGITEFLPISSTAHLRLLPWAFGVDTIYPLLASAQFDIALHAGSFVAILVALWPDWTALVSGAIGRAPKNKKTVAKHSAASASPSGALSQAPFAADPTSCRRFLGFLVITSVPGAILGALFDTPLEKYSTPSLFHYAPLLVGGCLALFGVVLWAVDRFVARQEPIGSMTWGRSLMIGLAQAVALVPGVSRSGATMTAGRSLGLSREASARYSFLAAAPIIGGAAVWGLRHVPLSTLLSLDWVLGFAAAAVSSFFFVRWMLGYMQRHSYSVFTWYRIVAGVCVIALFFFR
jgi:undecaprenyl-diphosphatase